MALFGAVETTRRFCPQFCTKKNFYAYHGMNKVLLRTCGKAFERCG
ncbi:hypothetical protein HMPREF0281_01719 [Corynebacterium ammoniagenes DSM 20306]|uniref:Uncharacterized protein n=1 Tax=Corynebacterium ammoniagenes DSM 20306 TaxID=649754 RepID=A0ABP2IHQ4_CORAM|nr:hypothetical protein HMPREF0281_01719 [Corynebacterium ammoniagenes DSM 20306]